MQTVTRRSLTTWYMVLISALGMVFSLHSAWRFFFFSQQPWTGQRIGIFAVLAVLCWLCCCLPLYVRDDCTVDLSFISVLASVLVMGTDSAIVVNLITYPLVVIPAPDGKGHSHVFNTAPIKTLFNMGNHSISYQLGGLVSGLLGGQPGDIALPDILPPAIGFIVASMVANIIVIMLYFMFTQNVKPFPTVFQMFLGLAPSIALSSPIGYFLAMLLGMENGAWLALLFMLPLLLARYSFKLYLDGQRQQFSIIKAFAAALEAKDTYTLGHSSRVAAYTVQIATEMGLSERRIRRLSDAALFHDIGKIGVPDSILQKPGALTPEERAVIQRHPQTGVDILGNLDSYQELLPLILHHHEFYDGGGYPDGTRGDEIPLDTYILGAADAFDAITSDRPYRSGRSPQAAAAILQAESGKQFHPKVVAAVAAMVERGELGPRRTTEEIPPC